jgi:hypothetical protein
VFPSAAYTATQTSTPARHPGGLDASGRGYARGVLLVIDCTVDPAVASVTFDFQSAAGGEAFASILVSPAVDAVGTTLMAIHPDIDTAAANLTSLGPLESRYQVVATHADASSITYSVEAYWLH